jgi:hypothetical protein
MNLYESKQLADSMRVVRKNTIAIAEDIPEAQRASRVCDPQMSGHRATEIAGHHDCSEDRRLRNKRHAWGQVYNIYFTCCS